MTKQTNKEKPKPTITKQQPKANETKKETW